MDKKNSGVGVLDKAVKILATLESGPHSLSELVAATGIARPTAHRLAVALEFHRLVTRDLMGRFVLGARSSELAAAAGEDRLLAIAAPALGALRDATGESAQLYRRQGDQRRRDEPRGDPGLLPRPPVRLRPERRARRSGVGVHPLVAPERDAAHRGGSLPRVPARAARGSCR